MAWEWAGPAGTTFVGVVGIISTWLTAKQGREHTVLMTGADRRYQRHADAYVELLTVAEQTGDAIALWTPESRSAPPQPEPEVPTPEAQARLFALIAAFGSPEIRTAFNAWRDAVQNVINRARAMQDVMEERERMGRPISLTPALNDFRQSKLEEQSARQALGFLVREDLALPRTQPFAGTESS